ncbi:hypothetical protein QZH41_003718 [Actinostola sp. cb2023]|nr:hypothetical protein QZH41_003718 [Actinostola sp. cb2023]
MDIALATMDFALATMDLALATMDLALATMDFALATMDLAIAIMDLAIATMNLAIATMDLELATMDIVLTIATIQKVTSSPQPSVGGRAHRPPMVEDPVLKAIREMRIEFKEDLSKIQAQFETQAKEIRRNAWLADLYVVDDVTEGPVAYGETEKVVQGKEKSEEKSEVKDKIEPDASHGNKARQVSEVDLNRELLNESHVEMVEELLDRNADVFSEGPEDYGHTETLKHRIPLIDETPFKIPHRRVRPAEYKELVETLKAQTKNRKKCSKMKKKLQTQDNARKKMMKKKLQTQDNARKKMMKKKLQIQDNSRKKMKKKK